MVLYIEMVNFSVILSLAFGYILLLFSSLFGFFGGVCFGIGELGSVSVAIVILPIPFIIAVISSIYYYKKHKDTENKFVYFLRFSIVIFILAVFSGYVYKIVEISDTENYLRNAGNIVEEYKNANNLETLTEDDFDKINLPEDVEVDIREDGYTLKYKYGRYSNGNVRTRRP